MHVVAYDPFVSPERFRELGVERVEDEDGVYEAADFITLHLPLTDETRASIDAKAFARMRDGVRIVNAARGELVDEAALLEVLRPYIPLAAKLGRLVMELAEGRVEELRLTYFGGLAQYDTRLLTVAALNGAFQGRSDQPVNYVNAPVIAAERGVDVREERSRSTRDYTNLVRVEAVSAGEALRVAGTTIGNENRLWLVSALGFELDMELAPLLA